MAILNVNPTRMELTNLKGKLTTATRGHKLLKDKRDELMREFIDLVRENKEVRREVEAGIAEANAHMAIARSVMSDEALNVALMLPMQEMNLDISEKNVMSVYIPVFDIKYKTADENDIYSYGYAFTSSDLDDAVKALRAGSRINDPLDHGLAADGAQRLAGEARGAPAGGNDT